MVAVTLVAQGDGTEGHAGLRWGHSDRFPSQSVPSAQVLCVPRTGPTFRPSVGLCGQSSAQSPSLPVLPTASYKTWLLPAGRFRIT